MVKINGKTVIWCLIGTLAVCWGKWTKKFEFGASTAAFQIEGAWLDDRKGMSVWDNIAHSGEIADNSTADIVGNSYYLYPQDISIMKEYGIKHYRMSVAWARILPYGVKGSEVNRLAIDHYRKQFEELLQAGITPYVTLYHNDMPMNMRILGDGYTDPDFVEDFTNYADVCFEHFGDLVKYWFTFNEPWCLAVLDYFSKEEASTGPYKRGHQLLLAHSEAVDLYRKKYQQQQGGKIGWVVNSEMYYPLDPHQQDDIDAANRCLAFQLDWFSEPLFTGEYPKIMRDILRERLPEFTSEQKAKLIGSLDFYAVNHYFTLLTEPPREELRGFWEDRKANTTKGTWNRTDNDWPIVPEGLHDLLAHAHSKWLQNSNLEVFITENGAAINEANISEANNDLRRVHYLQRYLEQVERAISEGINVTKYFIWSLLDNFEWGAGVSARFGIVRVEYGPDPKRFPKSSMKWYAELIKSQS